MITETKEYQFFLKRMHKLCYENINPEDNISPYRICKNCDMNPSTLNNILNGVFTDPRLSTIARVCEGLDIDLKEFFNDEMFENEKVNE